MILPLIPLGMAAGLGSGLGLTMKGDNEPGAYAPGEFDIPSYTARKELTDYLNLGQEEQLQDFQSQIQRGIENRVAVKTMENQRLAGPHLAASNVESIPGFLSQGPQSISGADRGTLHGQALADAIGRGETTVDPIQVALGPKGSSTGLRNEAIPGFVPGPTAEQLLPNAAFLHGQAQQTANQINVPKGK